MTVLIAGLIVFLGIHSVRVVADGWRAGMIDRHGEKRWKGLFSIISLVGFGLIIWGYALARENPVLVWDPPLGMRHVAVLLMAPAFFLVAQNGNPKGPITARIGHPMSIAVIIWSIAHLGANGTLADIVLFGAFLVWAILAFLAARRRDAAEGAASSAAGWRADLLPGFGGIVLWLIFIWAVHEWLFGVAPLG